MCEISTFSLQAAATGELSSHTKVKGNCVSNRWISPCYWSNNNNTDSHTSLADVGLMDNICLPSVGSLYTPVSSTVGGFDLLICSTRTQHEKVKPCVTV